MQLPHQENGTHECSSSALKAVSDSRRRLAERYPLTARLCVRFEQQEAFLGQAEIWDHFQTSICLQTPVSDLPLLLKTEVQHRVLSDHILRRNLMDRHCVVKLRSSLRLPSGNWGKFLVTELGSIVKNIAGLFADPTKRNLSMHVSVALNLERSAINHSIRELVICEDAKSQIQYYRLGKMPTADDRLRSKLSVRQMKRFAKDVEIGYVWALLGWIDPKDGRPCLSRVHTYDFDGFCIGDCWDWTPWNRIKFDHRADYLLPYSTISRRGERKEVLTQLLEKHIRDGASEPGSGVPFLPCYNFNIFKPDQYGLGVREWPQRGIDIAVRCVNHFRPDPALKHVYFPPDIRLEIERQDTVETIKAAICQEIDKTGFEDGVRTNSATLFMPKYRGCWDMELWAMPQKDGPQKLFRYTEGRLTQFLSASPKVRSKDKRLYMEAHFVQRDGRTYTEAQYGI